MNIFQKKVQDFDKFHNYPDDKLMTWLTSSTPIVNILFTFSGTLGLREGIAVYHGDDGIHFGPAFLHLPSGPRGIGPARISEEVEPIFKSRSFVVARTECS